jgi:hypothetical protein
MANVINAAFSKESLNLLQHMIEIERLKTIMRFYKKYGTEKGFSWALNLHKNINDSRQENPCIIAYSKEEASGTIKLKGVVTYSVSRESYNVQWYLHKEGAQHPEQVDDVTLITAKYLAVINHLEKHLSKDRRDSDAELTEDYDWDI